MSEMNKYFKNKTIVTKNEEIGEGTEYYIVILHNCEPYAVHNESFFDYDKAVRKARDLIIEVFKSVGDPNISYVITDFKSVVKVNNRHEFYNENLYNGCLI